MFLAIQTFLSCRFLLAVDSLSPRWTGSSSRFIDPLKDSPKQVPEHGHFGHLEGHVARVASDLGADLDQLPMELGERPVFKFPPPC